MAVNCGSCAMPKTCELNSLNCVGPAEGLGSLALTGMAPGGTEKGSTQRAKAGGDHNLIRTDHRARSLESMHFLKSQSTPTAAANLAIAGSLATLLYCTLRCHFHMRPWLVAAEHAGSFGLRKMVLSLQACTLEGLRKLLAFLLPPIYPVGLSAVLCQIVSVCFRVVCLIPTFHYR